MDATFLDGDHDDSKVDLKRFGLTPPVTSGKMPARRNDPGRSPLQSLAFLVDGSTRPPAPRLARGTRLDQTTGPDRQPRAAPSTTRPLQRSEPMPSILRASFWKALSLAGASTLTLGTIAQAQQDETVQKTTTQASAGTATAPAATSAKEPLRPISAAALAPVPFGTLDIDQVMRNYDKVKVAMEKLQAEALEEQNNLMRLNSQGKNLVEQLQRFKQGSKEFHDATEQIGEIKAKIEAKKEALQAEFEMKSAESTIAAYADVQLVAEGVAKKYKMGYVVKVVREPLSANDRQSAQAIFAQPLIYSDASTDITKEVIYYLNMRYQKSGGVPPKAATASTAAPAQAAPAAAAAAPSTSQKR